MNNQILLKECQEIARLMQKAIWKIYPFSKIKVYEDMYSNSVIIDVNIFYKNKDFILRKMVNFNELNDKRYLMYLARHIVSDITEAIMGIKDD